MLIVLLKYCDDKYYEHYDRVHLAGRFRIMNAP